MKFDLRRQICYNQVSTICPSVWTVSHCGKWASSRIAIWILQNRQRTISNPKFWRQLINWTSSLHSIEFRSNETFKQLAVRIFVGNADSASKWPQTRWLLGLKFKEGTALSFFFCGFRLHNLEYKSKLYNENIDLAMSFTKNNFS